MSLQEFRAYQDMKDRAKDVWFNPGDKVTRKLLDVARAHFRYLKTFQRVKTLAGK